MKVKIRRSNQGDLDNVFNLHAKCFTQADQWYKSAIRSYLDKGIVVELKDTNQLIAVLLQGSITPCNHKFMDSDDNDKYQADVFDPVNDTGKMLQTNNLHFKELFGIVMICVDPQYRGKGLAKKIIEKHFQDNPNKVVCLNTRKSNIGAFMLYKSMGYEHVAYIRNKYFLPTEDSVFMIKDLTEEIKSNESNIN